MAVTLAFVVSGVKRALALVLRRFAGLTIVADQGLDGRDQGARNQQ
jgi:hypothetical protein